MWEHRCFVCAHARRAAEDDVAALAMALRVAGLAADEPPEECTDVYMALAGAGLKRRGGAAARSDDEPLELKHCVARHASGAEQLDKLTLVRAAHGWVSRDGSLPLSPDLAAAVDQHYNGAAHRSCPWRSAAGRVASGAFGAT